MTKHVSIALQPTDAYWREEYGQVLESSTQHLFTGRGIHNPSFNHVLRVWLNKRRTDGSGGLKDPHGQPTEERHSYLWSAQPSVIALQPQARPEQGVTLELGDVVTLTIHGYVLGDFQIRARRAYDPHMVPVDTSSSASRQHFIETGEYLAPGETL